MQSPSDILLLVMVKSRAVSREFPENSFPVHYREIFRFPGNFREFFMYCGGTNSSISRFFKYFSFGLDQTLLSKKIVSKLKIIVIRQKNAFSLKNGMFLIFYIVSFQFPGIPGNFPEKFGNSRFPGNEIVREIISPNYYLHISRHLFPQNWQKFYHAEITIFLMLIYK